VPAYLILSRKFCPPSILATGVSRSRVREFRTVYPLHCGSLTLNLDILTTFKGISVNSVWRDRGALVTL